MSLTALVIVLVAATLHATWNLFLAAAPYTQAATGVALSAGVLVALPFAILRWHVEPAAWPCIAASSVLELTYFWLLTTAYARAEMSLVYPIARGMAPVIVLLVSVLVLGAATSILQVCGVALVGVGVILVRGLHGAARWADVALALLVASAIAGYTLVDKQGIQYADPVTYVTLILIMPAIVATAAVYLRSGRARVVAAIRPKTALAGVASLAAYGLVLVALSFSPAASVAAVREVGVVIATAFAAFVLHERVGPSRWIGSIATVGGIALVVAA